MITHDDVFGRILTILKQDDYYQTLEELLVINNLTAYVDIQLFPKLYDTTTIIERVTGEADLIERQLRQPAAETHQPMSSSPLQNIPKSANGEGVKNSKPMTRPNATDERLCF